MWNMALPRLSLSRGILPVRNPAHLQLGRAYALETRSSLGANASAARAKARTAYQSFLTLWKGADPNIPIFRQAKIEYTKRQ